MPIERDSTGSTMITGEAIGLYRLLALKSALGLEIKGIKVTRHSVYAQVKRELGLKGSKQAVYEQLCSHIDRVGPELARK